MPLPIILGTLAGLIAGSFVGALVTRWPHGISVATGRSRCDACGVALAPRDLVPVLSFLRARGRCRTCGARIDAQHLAAELSAAFVGGTAFAVAPPLVALAGAAFGWTLVALALLDARHFWLPDRLTLPLAVGGIAAAAGGLGPTPVDSLIGLAVGYGGLRLLAAAYRTVRGRDGLGGGDPKIFGALGAWLGWSALPIVLLMASLVGLASVALRRLRRAPVSATDRLPLGALLAVAAWPVWLVTAGLR